MHIHQHNLPLPGQEDEKYIQPMADTFKVLSDPTRIRILALLGTSGNVCHLHCRGLGDDTFCYQPSAAHIALH